MINEITGRRSTSVKQLELLVEFMEAHQDIALGRLRSKEARALATDLWTQCANTLNAEGVTRTPKEWMKFWNDYKCRVRGKLAEVNKSKSSGGGSSAKSVFTPLEDRVAIIMGRDVGLMNESHNDTANDEDQKINIVIMDMPCHEEARVPNTSSPRDSPIMDALDTPDFKVSPINSISPTGSPISSDHNDQEREIPIEQRPSGSNSAGYVSNSRQRKRKRVSSRFPHQSNSATLQEVRASIARIEEMRARTDETLAAATLRQADAARKQADALNSLAQSFQTFVACFQGYVNSVQRNN